MKQHLTTLIITGVALTLAGCAQTQQGVEDSELGLSKTSVFATPQPIVATSDANDPGENETVESYFEGAPPVIPHQVEDYLPIRVGENLCIDCHDLPDQIGQPREVGDPTPIPITHYTDLRRSPGEAGDTLIGARYLCSQCHAPQAAEPPLGANTYRQ